MEETWLNPEFATEQVVVLAAIVLASLLLLPVVFGALIYGGLSLYARLSNRVRKLRNPADLSQEEVYDETSV